jgi:hypothetical protein
VRRELLVPVRHLRRTSRGARRGLLELRGHPARAPAARRRAVREVRSLRLRRHGGRPCDRVAAVHHEADVVSDAIVKRDVDVAVVKTTVGIRVEITLFVHGTPAPMDLPMVAQNFDPGLRAEEAIAQLLEQHAAWLRQFAIFTLPMTAADIGTDPITPPERST